MLLGCCHCESESLPPSDSQPPSESGSSATTVTSCTVCGIAPRNFTVTITNPTDSSACCCDQYSGGFILRYASGCTWESSERMLCAVRPNPGDSYCITALIDEPRIALTISKAGSVYSYLVRYRYHFKGISNSQKQTHTYRAASLASCFVTATANWQSTALEATAANQCYLGAAFTGHVCAAPSAYTRVNSNIVVAPV